MINSEPLSIMTQTVANRSAPVYTPNNYQASQYNVNPTTRLTIEQLQQLSNQYQQPLPQTLQQTNDPYTSGSMLLAQCSDLVRAKIMQDPQYQQIDNECEILIKQYLYGNIIPQILNTQQGRIAFERWEQCIKELKQEYSKEEVAMTQNINVLLSDPVVMARLQELQQQTLVQNQPPKSIKQQKRSKVQNEGSMNVEGVNEE